MPNHSAESPDHTPAGAGSDHRQGAFIEGGEFHDQIIGYQAIYTEEQAYNVAGLPNPYLGLRAFTAAERDIFAGRERIVQALVQRLAADDGDRLLFLVGASGSGKSSLARAGLLPALETRLRERGLAVETHILDRPGLTLTTALTRLQPTSTATFTTLLLIDQFEELWSQLGLDEAQQVLDLLLDLATRFDRPLRIVVTLRSDFLPQLAADARFETFVRRVVFVRVMSADELKDAIQRPVQARHPDKRLEPALVERLAQDAAPDAAYLPLLQVTLEDLWRGGSLRLATYSGLADAIQRRAETVYAYRDHNGLQQEERPAVERETILAMLLDLVRVSPGEEQRETRWRRTRAELIQGDVLREQLITDLTAARLLRTDHETDENGCSVETVDVVHEALLRGWPRLRKAIEAEYERLSRRERFLLALQEWQTKEHQDNYLLSGTRLAEAEILHKEGDSAFYEPKALLLYERSVQQRNQERQHQIQRARTITIGFGVLALLALFTAGIAMSEQQRAERQVNIAEARRLAAETTSLLLAQDSSEQALLLAIEGVLLNANPTNRQTLQQAVARQPYTLQILANHTSLSSAMFSPHGTHILIVSDDGTAQLWKADGTSLATLQDHTNSIISAIFSLDGMHILTASHDGTAQLWNLDGTLKTSFQGHTGRMLSAVFSPDGRHILTASSDRTARLWNLDGTLQTSFQGHTDQVLSAVFSPDGRHILTASSDRTARLWNLNGTLQSFFQDHSYFVDSPVFSPDGTHILTASDDRTARLWNLDGTLQTSFQGHTDWVNSAVFSPDGMHILTASSDRTARLWNLDGTLQTSFQGHTDWVNSAVFSPDGMHILTASDDRTARLWNLDGTLQISFQGHTDRLLSAVFSPDGAHILTASKDETARLWNLDGTLQTSFQGHTDWVLSAVFSPDGNHILTASDDRTARLWNLDGTLQIPFQGHTGPLWIEYRRGGRPIAKLSDDRTTLQFYPNAMILNSFQGHTYRVLSAMFSSDGKHIITASDDRIAQLWNLDGTLQLSFQGHTGPVWIEAFSPDGKRIITASSDGTARLWNLDGTLQTSFQGHTDRVLSAVFSLDGNQILTASDDGTARLWNLDGTLQTSFQGHTDRVLSAVFSLDGNQILTASADGTARLWNLDGTLQTSFQGHTDRVLSAVFSPDKRHILTASDDGTARLWSLDGTLQTSLQGHTDRVLSAVFSPDGKRILTASADGTARLWPVELEDWLLAAKCRVGRILTTEEIRDYQVPTPLAFDATALAERQCPPVYSWER